MQHLEGDLVRSIGADEVIDYTREDIADGTRRYDVIVDTAGNRESVITPASAHPEGNARARRRRRRRTVARDGSRGAGEGDLAVSSGRR